MTPNERRAEIMRILTTRRHETMGRLAAELHLVYVFKDGTKVKRVWKDKSRRDSWTDEMRAQAAVHARRRYA